jgi:hypothetical protein
MLASVARISLGRRQAMPKPRATIAFAECMLSAQVLAAEPPTRILVNANILTMDAEEAA